MSKSALGSSQDSAEYWEKISTRYADDIKSNYHDHRLSVVRHLMPDVAGKSVLDFGCGDGIICEQVLQGGADCAIGIDPNHELISVATEHIPGATFKVGGVDSLGEYDDGSFDLIVAANVLAYFTDSEEATFYREVQRLLKPGGHFVVTHSNELFDLFTFNKFTVDFYRREFDCDPTSLISNPQLPDRHTYNVRENPLSYPEKLKAFDLAVEQTEYANHHHAPPLLSGDVPDDMARERKNTLKTPDKDKWKLNFQCSMFGIRAVRG